MVRPQTESCSDADLEACRPCDAVAPRAGCRALYGPRLRPDAPDRRRSLFSRLRRIDRGERTMVLPKSRPVHGPPDASADRGLRRRREAHRLAPVAQTRATLIRPA